MQIFDPDAGRQSLLPRPLHSSTALLRLSLSVSCLHSSPWAVSSSSPAFSAAHDILERGWRWTRHLPFPSSRTHTKFLFGLLGVLVRTLVAPAVSLALRTRKKMSKLVVILWGFLTRPSMHVAMYQLRVGSCRYGDLLNLMPACRPSIAQLSFAPLFAFTH